MGEREPTKSWWQTLPGIITGVAALITAVAGLPRRDQPRPARFSRATSAGAQPAYAVTSLRLRRSASAPCV